MNIYDSLKPASNVDQQLRCQSYYVLAVAGFAAIGLNVMAHISDIGVVRCLDVDLTACNPIIAIRPGIKTSLDIVESFINI